MIDELMAEVRDGGGLETEGRLGGYHNGPAETGAESGLSVPLDFIEIT